MHLNAVIAARLGRRDFLKALGGTALAGIGPASFLSACGAERGAAARGLTFAEIGNSIDPYHHVPPGYRADILLRWGDAIAGGGAFDPSVLTAADQQKRFGYNCDFVGYLPLHDTALDVDAHLRSGSSRRGLLCVNHEFVNAELMFPGFADGRDAFINANPAQIEVQMAALGVSVVSVAREGAGWHIESGSPFGRRIDAFTPIDLTGPAAGHPRLMTPADPTGLRVQGTFQNCAGGITPWGTMLSAEENFHQAFGGSVQLVPAADFEREAVAYDEYRIGGGNIRMPWIRIDKRFDIAVAPNEPNRFGWIVEIDPYDPSSTPKKRTALGRFAHEAGTVVAAPGGPAVVYMGDDARNQFAFKFVSARAYDAARAQSNRNILDEGTLYAARFAPDGTGRWLALVHGQEPLTAGNGFHSQADVLIEARRAARLLGATPMDRPEDIETSPVTGRTYIVLTGNTDRTLADAANPRAPNRAGHILEIVPPGQDGARDHAAETFTWNVFLLAGDPAAAAEQAKYGPGLSATGWFACPDNLCFDPAGRLWIATDGADAFGIHDGLWACETLGTGRAVTRHFFGCPTGAELCGPCFTPDGTSLFVAVQHPGADPGSTFDNPSTRWPDFQDGMPPRPAVVAITREDGGVIGG